MRYTIEGFSQQEAIKYKKQVSINGKQKIIKIDCTDLVILRWFVDFFPNMRKMNADGKEYAWLSHKKLQEDLPILDISKRSCIDRMQKLVEFEILEYKCLKEGGTFSLYRFGKNYESLISSNVDGMQSNNYGDTNESAEGVRSNSTGVNGQPANKDSSIKDTSIKDTFNNIITEYTQDEKTIDLLQEWIKVRKAKHSAMTARAIQMNIDKLDELAKASNMTVNEYLAEVIRKGWAAFYEIKQWNNNNNKNGKTYGATGVEIKTPEVDDLKGIL